jgi:hypothetical protein
VPRAISAVFALILAAATVDAATVTVNCGGSRGLTSISQALKWLSHEGPNTLRVLGACHENVTVQGFDRLSLDAFQGASIEDASGGQQNVLDIRDSRDVEIQGFRIVGGYLGVACGDASLCRFAGNTFEGAAFYGVWVHSSQATFFGDTIQDASGSALYVETSIVDATNLTAQRSGGIALFHKSVLTGSELTVKNNTQDGIGVTSQSHLSLSGSQVSDNAGCGINFSNQSQGVLSGQNNITGNGIFGVGLGDLSNAYFDGGTITGNQFNDIGCWGRYSVTSNLGGVVYGTTDCQ